MLLRNEASKSSRHFAVTIEVQDILTGRQYHSDLGLYASGSSDPCIQWQRGAPALSVIELDVYICQRGLQPPLISAINCSSVVKYFSNLFIQYILAYDTILIGVARQL